MLKNRYKFVNDELQKEIKQSTTESDSGVFYKSDHKSLFVSIFEVFEEIYNEIVMAYRFLASQESISQQSRRI